MNKQDIINQGLELYISNLRQVLEQEKLNATGQTSANIRIGEVGENSGAVNAPASIMTLVHGRRPTSGSGNGTLVEAIDAWLKAKGLDLNKYAVAKKIHKEGTTLFRGGHKTLGAPPTDILQRGIPAVSDFLKTNLTRHYSNEVITSIKQMNK